MRRLISIVAIAALTIGATLAIAPGPVECSGVRDGIRRRTA